ncbi:MAG TPA: tRNA lysidine(34) synthetase TilS, partial [Planctomycetota bacterium]|nr:tRNA lysidine(34) synthetase TilS [Planctomycetota bacterium]
ARREGRSKRERPTLQEAARELRYEALRGLAAKRGAAHIATAHHLDDQAETVLLRLLRGAGPDGLGGIPERSPDGVVIRPLLDVPRAEIERFAAERGLHFREDASNHCDDYARNRLRRHWLPGLARDFNPRLLRAIGRVAEAHRRDGEWISEIVEQVLEARIVRVEGDGFELHRDGWSDLPEALARRVVARLLVRAELGRDLSHTHVVRVLSFLCSGDAANGAKSLELPGGLRLVMTRRGFTLSRVAIDAGES